MKKTLTAVAALAVMGLWSAGSAEAATCNVALGGPNSQDYTVDVATVAECGVGNPNSATIMIGGTTYTQGIDDGGNPTTGSPLSWGIDPMSGDSDAGTQNWSINLAASWMGEVLLQLKQANSYGIFDVTDSCDFGTNLCSGTWSAFTNNPGGGSENDLSNTRAWYATGLANNPVPLPAAGWLLLAGVGGLAAMRRRKKA